MIVFYFLFQLTLFHSYPDPIWSKILIEDISSGHFAMPRILSRNLRWSATLLKKDAIGKAFVIFLRQSKAVWKIFALHFPSCTIVLGRMDLRIKNVVWNSISPLQWLSDMYWITISHWPYFCEIILCHGLESNATKHLLPKPQKIWHGIGGIWEKLEYCSNFHWKRNLIQFNRIIAWPYFVLYKIGLLSLFWVTKTLSLIN